MNQKFLIGVSVGILFTPLYSEILYLQKPKVQEEVAFFSMQPAKDPNKTNVSSQTQNTQPVLSSQPKQFYSEFIPKPNEPVPEKDKLVIPLTPPSDPPRFIPNPHPQFGKPFPHKFIARVNFSANPENPHKGVLLTPIESNKVLATLEGKVVAIDYMDGYNNYIILEHSNGYFTVYGNLDTVFVAEGQKVKKGDHLGNLLKEKGLYFQVNQGKKILDPISFIKS
ncbi:MAG TPA: M23 family metallopeptidase [Leptospiraceae bacterium]|nr:M23 family metallopeptidase [Leptospiraceae bacterium]HMW08528.1 M23 family metallopeptidase [Leptospiraceae bacterium]HMX35229.1 M23 family metallopeptidase [Leptospiraceae bacterium]HMY34215.1 M23 family metallopeptidase [Leptospiraceae bacterium]HMZ66533.1 M23 family metallopeptidase [Leptospiraceae bacterium]